MKTYKIWILILTVIVLAEAGVLIFLAVKSLMNASVVFQTEISFPWNYKMEPIQSEHLTAFIGSRNEQQQAEVTIELIGRSSTYTQTTKLNRLATVTTEGIHWYPITDGHVFSKMAKDDISVRVTSAGWDSDGGAFFKIMALRYAY